MDDYRNAPTSAPHRDLFTPRKTPNPVFGPKPSKERDHMKEDHDDLVSKAEQPGWQKYRLAKPEHHKTYNLDNNFQPLERADLVPEPKASVLPEDAALTGTQRSAARAETVAGIIRQRGQTHGDAFANLEDTARRWTQKLRSMGYAGPDLTLVDVCEFIQELKLSRASFGDALEIDHQNDIAGYAIIAASWIEKQKTLASE